MDRAEPGFLLPRPRRPRVAPLGLASSAPGWLARAAWPAFLLVACGAPGAKEGGGEAEFAITGVTVIDVEAGEAVPERTILISGDRIEAILDADVPRPPTGTRTLDGRGLFAVPGLWDMHVHALFDPDALVTFLPLFLANGVTGIRDMGGRLDLLKAVRERTATGLLAPRLVAAGPFLDGAEVVDARATWRVTTPAQGRAAVDSLARAGADFIKVYTQLERDVFQAVAAAAREAGLPVAGHVPYALSDAEAAASLRSIEHMRSETGGFCTSREPERCREAFAAFLRHGTWQTPTLAVRRHRARGGDPALADDPRLRYLPASLQSEWDANRQAMLARGPGHLARVQAEHREEVWLAGALDSAGIGILAGSDAGSDYALPGFTLHDELELLVEAGLEPLEALRAATLNAARYLGATDSLGAIAPGRLADLVLLEANPLEEIRSTRRIRAVVLGGRLLGRGALDSLLAAAQAAAAASTAVGREADLP